MKRRHFLKLALASLMPLTVCALGAVPTAPPSQATDGRFIVHEWGTFLSVQGSDGTTQGGMVDSEDTLPSFVRERSLGGISRAMIFQKGETPVTYFYSDRPRTVHVRVDMPEGLLTHWFPSVRTFGPPVDESEIQDPFASPRRVTPLPSGGSFLDWGQVQIVPDTFGPVHGLPLSAVAMRPADDHWSHARQTDAALVLVGPENAGTPRRGDYERFLFYRGLGMFDLPLKVQVPACCKSAMELANLGSEVLQAIHLIYVSRDGIAFSRLPDLAGKQSQSVSRSALSDTKLSLKEGVAKVKASVAASLVEAGLYPKEAQAMVNTWEKSYFQTEGLRVLYIVPRRIVDQVFPLYIKPAPQQLARVMVGRVEVLTPDREYQIERAVADLSSRDPVARKAAQVTLTRLGRIREPALHRIAIASQQPLVRARAQELIRQHEPPRL
jgi:hypothetical protein